jgi:hypothetical protein
VLNCDLSEWATPCMGVVAKAFGDGVEGSIAKIRMLELGAFNVKPRVRRADSMPCSDVKMPPGCVVYNVNVALTNVCAFIFRSHAP